MGWPGGAAMTSSSWPRGTISSCAPARRHRHDAEVDVAGEARRVDLVGAPVGELHAHARDDRPGTA